MSCEDEDKYGKTAADSAKAVIESVRVMENEEYRQSILTDMKL